MRNATDIARRRAACVTKRTPSPSGTASDTDSSSSSASRAVRAATSPVRPLAAR